LAELLREMKIDIAIFEPFTKAFASISAPEFVTGYLVAPLRPKAIVVGQNFNFGRGRAGSAGLLSQMGPLHGFTVEGIAPVSFNGEIVSSSRIRKAVQEGDMPLAEALLGRPFSVEGPVITGAGRGRKIGVPTANMRIAEVISPKRGVYATFVETRDGRRWPAVSNLGVAPTFSTAGDLMLETHILDQKMELVGTELRVHFLSYLREERRFADVSELVAQIQRDIAQAAAVWSSRGEVGGHRS
jgi:riboflavin kinase/FMN adenylyltransferase